MATMSTSDNKWSLSFNAPVTATGTSTNGTVVTKTLATAGKFVDKNIEINVTPVATVPAASNYTLNVNSISGTSEVSVGTLSSGFYPLTANNVSVTATLGASTAGWFSTSGQVTDSDTDGVSIGKIAAGSCTVAGGVLSTSGYSKTNLSNTINCMSSLSSNAYIFGNEEDVLNNQTYGDYYFEIEASTPAVSGNTSASVTAITDTHVAGYIPAKTTTNFRNAQSASPSVSVNATSISKYLGIRAAEYSIQYSGDTSATPVISKKDFTSNNYINAADGSAIETPIMGGVYVRVGTSSLTKSITGTVNVSTAGYAPVNSTVNRSQTFTVNAATDKYIPIKTDTIAVSGGSLNNKNATIDYPYASASTGGTSMIISSTDDNNNGLYIQPSGAAGRTNVACSRNINGYINQASGTEVLSALAQQTWNGTTQYLKGVRIIKPSSGTSSFSIGRGDRGAIGNITASVSQNALDGFLEASICATNITSLGTNYYHSDIEDGEVAVDRIVSSSGSIRGYFSSYGGGTSQDGVLGFEPYSSSVGSLYATGYFNNATHSKKIIENGIWKINYNNTTARTNATGFCFKAGSYYYCFRWYSSSSNRFQFLRSSSANGTLIDTIMPNEIAMFDITRSFGSSIESRFKMVLSPSRNIVMGVDSASALHGSSNWGASSASYFNAYQCAFYQTFPTSWTDLYYFRTTAT